jgi:hypothetical protein
LGGETPAADHAIAGFESEIAGRQRPGAMLWPDTLRIGIRSVGNHDDNDHRADNRHRTDRYEDRLTSHQIILLVSSKSCPVVIPYGRIR